MKIVGRQGTPKVDVLAIDSMQKMVNVLQEGCPGLPKGVWRFKSFEEADQWTMKMLTRPRHPAPRR
ncbi:MAG: hypothetical protein ABSG04_13915, partial [Verrucomicrobiota bacterium]